VSPRFVSDDIDEVRGRADIVEVIGEHVRLRKAGSKWKGLCPLHQEKTPSFSIDPDKGLWYCFGCNQGGSVFTFLEQVEGLSFPEAVESLAQRYNVQLREVRAGARAPSPRARLYSLQEAAVERYGQWLAAQDAEPVRSYMESRGITADIAERYKIGFGGWRRDGLVRAMLRAGFKGEELMTAGLATRDGRGMRDTFFGRLVFPIFDPSGRPVGLGGRVLPPEHRAQDVPDAPKYLNSRESPVFRKSRILYGTNWARAEVVQRKRLVVVEGYTDVIALHAAGIGEAVATCGTALTEDHMKEISTRFGDVRVVLCLDADAAGQAAMSRDRTEQLADNYSPGDVVRGSGWLPVGKGWLPEVGVANLPQGKDPADFVRAEGAEGMARVLEGAVPLVEFLLAHALEGAEVSTPEGRARAVRRGVEVLRQVGDSLLRHEYALWLSDRVGVDSYEVSRAIGERAAPRRKGPKQNVAAPVSLSGPHRIEREAVRALIAHPKLLDEAGEEDFTLPMHRSLYRLLAGEMSEQGRVNVARLSSRVTDEDVRRSLSELAVGAEIDAGVASDTLTRLRLATLDRNIVERKARLRTLDPDREAAAYDALFEELIGLEKQKRSVLADAANSRPFEQDAANSRPLEQDAANSRPLEQDAANSRPFEQDAANSSGADSTE
jgi:DNA primase